MGTLELCEHGGRDCLLRAKGIDSDFVAKLLVRLMAGEDVSDVMAGKLRISPRPECVACAHRVMRDQPPLPTVADFDQSVREGKRSHRRHRRHGRSHSVAALVGPHFP